MIRSDMDYTQMEKTCLTIERFVTLSVYDKGMRPYVESIKLNVLLFSFEYLR